jgi:hypothetical protein
LATTVLGHIKMSDGVDVPDGLEGWQIGAARCAAMWSYIDLVKATGHSLSMIQRIELLSPIIIRRAGERKTEGSADEATIAAFVTAFAKVGLELRPAKGSTPAAVIARDHDALMKRRAIEVRGRAKSAAAKR